MTKDQIRAELRRSAMENVRPLEIFPIEMWIALCRFRDLDRNEWFGYMTHTQWRLYLLVVAEAL